MRRINLLRGHGSPTGNLYRNHGCRCVACRGARAEYQRLYYAEHRNEHREERAEHSRKYQAEHKEEVAEYNREYKAEHREEIAAYKAAHPEVGAAYSRNRRALEANATGTHTAADVKTQYERQHGKCFWREVNPDCAVSLKGGHHVDHVIPLSGDRTSSNGPENIVLSCPNCNRRKSAKDPMDWSGMML